MSTAVGNDEEEALYSLLKPMEQGLPQILQRFFNRLERSLYQRLTVEQIEKLAKRPD